MLSRPQGFEAVGDGESGTYTDAFDDEWNQSIASDSSLRKDYFGLIDQ